MGLFQPFSIALYRSEGSMGGIRNDFRSVCSIGDDVNEANDPELGNFVTDPVGSKGCRLLLCIYFFYGIKQDLIYFIIFRIIFLI